MTTETGARDFQGIDSLVCGSYRPTEGRTEHSFVKNIVAKMLPGDDCRLPVTVHGSSVCFSRRSLSAARALSISLRSASFFRRTSSLNVAKALRISSSEKCIPCACAGMFEFRLNSVE